ncbi:MAG: hypothetical protein CSA62_12030 [Planctomycetota bacterium]|nr:MAG: hypothetical protein CSA62_12030 [Planctomycetota bacterium]
MSARVSVLILSWNTRELTLCCLRALEADPGRPDWEVIVLDNGSEDGSADAIEAEFSWARVLREPENLGYAVGNNRGARQASAEYLLLLNSDTEPAPGTIEAMCVFLDANPEYGACAPRLVHPDGRVQKSCKRWPGLAVACVYDLFWKGWPLLSRIDDHYFYRDFDHLGERDIEQPPGACFLIRRELWERLGGMDEELWLFYNDVDLCKRLHAMGFRIRYLGGLSVVHHEGASTARFAAMVEIWARNRMTYYRKHHGAFGHFLVRQALRVRGLQEWWEIGRRYPDPKDRRAARLELRALLQRALAPQPEAKA